MDKLNPIRIILIAVSSTVGALFWQYPEIVSDLDIKHMSLLLILCSLMMFFTEIKNQSK